MALDLDAWAERSAIMEYDAGLTRFNAETAAARAQGYERHEVMDEIRKRNSQPARDQHQATLRDAAGEVPGVQPDPSQEKRQVPERELLAGGDRGILPSLRMEDGGVLR